MEVVIGTVTEAGEDMLVAYLDDGTYLHWVMGWVLEPGKPVPDRALNSLYLCALDETRRR